MSMVTADLLAALPSSNSSNTSTSTTSSTTSLPAAFRSAQASYLDLQTSSLPSSSPQYQSLLNDALSAFNTAALLILKLSIFSPNEELDDINTSNLQYLLIDAYIGSLTLNIVNPKIDRWDIVHLAQKHFNAFLDTIDHYGLLNHQDKAFLTARLNNAFSKLPPDQQRASKINRYKQSKSIEAKLADLHSQLESFRSKTSNSSRSTANADNLIDELDQEEIEREWVLTLIQSFVYKVIDDLVSVQEELPMLERLKEIKKLEKEKMERRGERDNKRDQEDNSLRLDRPPVSQGGPLLSKEGKPLRPFILVDSKTRAEQIRANVFKPSHRLPTMTIDEYLEAESERMISGGGKPPAPKDDPDDQNEAAIDAETYKQRAWDEFKDDNPKGAGNRMNKG
ncbi:TAP42-like protein [Paraphysoderma sedebokerense]|nr:TAP42-like protein [Paraphysoderma sedebokerense]